MESEALKLAKDKFKEWTAFDRLKLLKLNLDHDYHLHPRSKNEQEGILLVNTILHVIKRTPKRLQVEFYEFVAQKLNNINIQTALGSIFNSLLNELVIADLQHAFNTRDTPYILSKLSTMPSSLAKSNMGTTLLTMALNEYNLAAINELLKLGANTNVGLLNPNNSSSDIEFYTFFHQAIKEGFVFIVKEMLNNGVDLSREVAGYAAIHTAAFYSKSQEIIDLIFKSSKDLELKSKICGMTPLHLAVQNNNIYLTKILLEKGVNPNPVNDLGCTPLSLVTLDNQNVVRELLVKYGAVVSFYQNVQTFPAFPISVNNHWIVTASTPLIDNHVFTLHKAIREGDVKVVQEMLKNGVDLNREVIGHAAIHATITAVNKSQEIIELIFQNCKNLELKSSLEGNTPLHLAVSFENLNCIKSLLSNRVNPNPVNNMQSTPLSLLDYDYQNSICELLVQHGADVNCNKSGEPLLAYHIRSNNRLIVQTLIRSGKVNLDLKTSTGKTLKELIAQFQF